MKRIHRVKPVNYETEYAILKEKLVQAKMLKTDCKSYSLELIRHLEDLEGETYGEMMDKKHQQYAVTSKPKMPPRWVIPREGIKNERSLPRYYQLYGQVLPYLGYTPTSYTKRDYLYFATQQDKELYGRRLIDIFEITGETTPLNFHVNSTMNQLRELINRGIFPPPIGVDFDRRTTKYGVPYPFHRQVWRLEDVIRFVRDMSYDAPPIVPMGLTHLAEQIVDGHPSLDGGDVRLRNSLKNRGELTVKKVKTELMKAQKLPDPGPLYIRRTETSAPWVVVEGALEQDVKRRKVAFERVFCNDRAHNFIEQTWCHIADEETSLNYPAIPHT